VARYLVSVTVERTMERLPPMGTFAVNMIGCALVGVFVGLSLQRPALVTANLRLFLVVGFCGGFTTFSAFGYDTVALLQGRHPALALLNIGMHVVGGLIAVWLGLMAARMIQG
jgi:fluoride exporter